MNQQRPTPGRSRSRLQVTAKRVDPNRSLRNHLVTCAAIAVGAGLLLYRLIPGDIVTSVQRVTEGGPTPATSPSSPADHSAQAAQWGSRFTPEPSEPDRAPELSAIPIPATPGGMAIWGAVGRSSKGQIYLGVSAVDWKGAKSGSTLKEISARLFEFDPTSRALRDRGGPVEQLKRLGLHRPGEQQQKIHSKIVEGADGAIYFASGDEAGADFSAGSPKNPTWPSHLWRIKSEGSEWEHLLSTPEHLIAVARGGDRIFALGWHGHVLYSFDPATGKVDRVEVGSMLGHISRNLATDSRGHAYVPRVKVESEGGARLVSTLVEYDVDLQEVGETPLEHYLGESPAASHGITGVQPLADGSIAFVTHAGYLYQIFPNPDRAADVAKLGWFYPTGSGHYIASLFTFDGVRHLLGVSQSESGAEWITFDLKAQRSRAAKLPSKVPVIALTSSSGEGPLSSLSTAELGSVYGCSTRDDDGNFYLVGRIGYDPVAYQARVGASDSSASSRSDRIAALRKLKPDLVPDRLAALASKPRSAAPVAPPARPEAPAISPAPKPVATEPAKAAPAPRLPAPPAESPLPDADAFPPSSPSLESSPAPAPAPALSLEVAWKKRTEFRKELFSILDAEGDNAGPIIQALCDRLGRDIPAEAKAAATILARTPVARTELPKRVAAARGGGIPEAVILLDILRLERINLGARDGPRSMDEARVRAARALLAIPLPARNPAQN